MEHFLHDATTWVLFAFILFCGLAWRVGRPIFLKKLDGRIEEIRKEIQVAESLRTEAQDLLAQYQRRQRDAAQEAEQILNNAKIHASRIMSEAEQELAESIKRREQQLADRLKAMEVAATAEIRAYATDLAIKATAEIITKTLDEKSNSRLVEESIEQVSKKLKAA